MISGAVINVKDFGAIGDYDEVTLAGTNDTVAIQAAIDAAAALPRKGAVYIPSGWYKITTALQIPYGVSIFGAGGTASIIYAANCNGLEFTTYGYELGSMFFEDFGVTSAGGANRIAVYTAPNASTMDGLYFSRMRLYGFNKGFVLASNWNCTIQQCVITEVNAAIELGSGNGQSIGIRILNNRMSRSIGGNGDAPPVGINAADTTQFNESVHIAFNQIFGFSRNITLGKAYYSTIFDNDLSGSGDVISFTTPEGGYNISNNFIEVRGSGTGIFGAPQSLPTPNTRTIITSNAFVGLDTAQHGIKLGGEGGQQQNAVIRDNTFVGFQINDIRLTGAGITGATLIDSNRCMSTAASLSIFVFDVATPLVVITNNYLVKALTLNVAQDYQNGKVIIANNIENNTFQSNKSEATPVTGTWRITDIVYNSTPATGEYIGWVCTVAGTPGTWKPFGLIA